MNSRSWEQEVEQKGAVTRARLDLGSSGKVKGERMLAVRALVSEMGLKCSALNMRQTAIHPASDSEER